MCHRDEIIIVESFVDNDLEKYSTISTFTKLSIALKFIRGLNRALHKTVIISTSYLDDTNSVEFEDSDGVNIL